MRFSSTCGEHADGAVHDLVFTAIAGYVRRLLQTAQAFEAFHRLFAADDGVEPPIDYTPAPPISPGAVEFEIRAHGVRFLVSVDFAQRVWLESITI